MDDNELNEFQQIIKKKLDETLETVELRAKMFFETKSRKNTLAAIETSLLLAGAPKGIITSLAPLLTELVEKSFCLGARTGFVEFVDLAAAEILAELKD